MRFLSASCCADLQASVWCFLFKAVFIVHRILVTSGEGREGRRKGGKGKYIYEKVEKTQREMVAGIAALVLIITRLVLIVISIFFIRVGYGYWI